MPYELYIPPCVCTPRHPHHPPPPDKPLRIQIEGPLVAIQRLLPESKWNMDSSTRTFPEEAAPDLAKMTCVAVYGHDVGSEIAKNIVVRDQQEGWVAFKSTYDYYGVTFDHLVPPEDQDPEVLQINITELEIEDGPFAGGVEFFNKYHIFTIDPADYIGKKVLAVPRCCQTRKGTTDRGRVNDSVLERDGIRMRPWFYKEWTKEST